MCTLSSKPTEESAILELDSQLGREGEGMGGEGRGGREGEDG